MSELKIIVTSLDLRPLGLLQLCRFISCDRHCVEICTEVLATSLQLCFDLHCIFRRLISALIKDFLWGICPVPLYLVPTASCSCCKMSISVSELVKFQFSLPSPANFTNAYLLFFFFSSPCPCQAIRGHKQISFACLFYRFLQL